MASKGSAFERDVCKQLSLWWTHNERDDVFWRTSTSGARATTRRKAGLSTFGQYGDVQATDPIGQPLIDMFIIEIKRGYPKATLSNVLDAGPHAKIQQLQRFIDQASSSACDAGMNPTSWLLIHKRDRRITTVTLPTLVYNSLRKDQNRKPFIIPFPILQYGLAYERGVSQCHITQFPFAHFLENIRPERIKELA